MEENQPITGQFITETGRSRRGSRLFTGMPDQLLVDETVRIPRTVSLDTKVQGHVNGIDIRGTYCILNAGERIELPELDHTHFIDGLETYIFQLREASLPILKIGLFDYLARNGIYNRNGADLRPDYEANLDFTEFVVNTLEQYKAMVVARKEGRSLAEVKEPLPVTVEFDNDDDIKLTEEMEVTEDIEEDSITGPTASLLKPINIVQLRGSKRIEVRERNRYDSSNPFYALMEGVSYFNVDDFKRNNFRTRRDNNQRAQSKERLEDSLTPDEMAFFDDGLKLETDGDSIVDCLELDTYHANISIKERVVESLDRRVASAKPNRSIFGRALAYSAMLVATAVTAVSAYLLHKEPEQQIQEPTTRAAYTIEHPADVVTHLEEAPTYTNEEATRILSTETRYTDEQAVNILANADITVAGGYECNRGHVPRVYQKQITDAGLDYHEMPPVYVCERTMEDVFQSVPDMTVLHWSRPEEEPVRTEKPQTIFNDPTTVVSYGPLQRADSGNATLVPTINNVVPRIILPNTMN